MNYFLILISFISLFLLSDIYYLGFGRVFDYFTLLICFGLFLLNKRLRSGYFNFFDAPLILIFLIFSPWLILSILNNSILAVFSMVLGFLFIVPIFTNLDKLINHNQLVNIINLTLLINLLFFIIQFVSYYIFDVFLDFSSAMGSIEGRALSASNIFRPSGLAQEPNAYSCFSIMLILLSVNLKRKIYILEYITLLTIFISFSLWGIFMSILVFFYLLKINTKKPVLILIIFLLVVLFNILDINNYLGDVIEQSIIFERLADIENDGSRIGRYGNFFDLFLNSDIIFGNGINTSRFQNFGANGFSFIIYSFGLVGGIIFFYFTYYIIKKNYFSLIVFILLCSSYPLFSYMYFYAGLGILNYIFLTQNKSLNVRN